jgi:hypothetical protein
MKNPKVSSNCTAILHIASTDAVSSPYEFGVNVTVLYVLCVGQRQGTKRMER